MSLVLIKPKWMAIKNSWTRRSLLSGQNARDLIILALGLSVMILIYRGATWALVHINANPDMLFLSPQYPLGMILSLLFFMLFLSGIAVAMGSLFLSDDLDLILASPLKKRIFFFNKLLYIIANSSWMPLIFITPLLLAFGISYQAPLYYYFISILVLLPYFLIAGSLAMLVAVSLARFVPANKSREVLIVVCIALLGLIYLVVDLIKIGFSSTNDTSQLSNLVSFLSIANVPWLPSAWAARCLQDFILPSKSGSLPYIILLYSLSIILTSFAHIIIHLYHHDAYTRTRNIRRAKSYGSRIAQIISLLLRFFSQTQRAVIKKEVFTFSRDVTHTIQLLMLIGLCAIYIFNLRVFVALENLPADSQSWWQKFFFVSHSSIAAFVTTGFCTRFVFVSLSLEGRSLWILQSSPLRFRDIMRSKFRCWYPLVSLLSTLVFTAAALSLGASINMLLLSTVACWFICYGIVGLAIGLGAKFSNFTWEHSSQLVAGFGNLVFMFASIGLVGINLIPACTMLFAESSPFSIFADSSLNINVFYLAMFTSMLLLNYLVNRIAIQEGERALVKNIDALA